MSAQDEQNARTDHIGQPETKVQFPAPSFSYVEDEPITVMSEGEAEDPVSAPSHYMKFGLSPQTLIEAFGLAFPEGNAIKYLARAKHKNNEIEDLKKAVWYSLRAYELACAKAEGRQPINIDNKQDDGNPFGSGFLRDLGVYQDGERAILNDRR